MQRSHARTQMTMLVLFLAGIMGISGSRPLMAQTLEPESTQTEPPSSLLVHDDFSDPADARWTGFKIADGRATLTSTSSKKYKSALALLKTPLPMPRAGESLHIQLTLAGMSDAMGGKFTGSARIFLAPAPLPTFAEPYGMDHTLWLYLLYKDGKPASLTLYRKANQKAFGTLLYRATLTEKDMPLTVTLDMGPDTYRLSFNRELSASRGARSGHTGLDAAKWSGHDIRFGIRAVNHRDGEQARLVLDEATFSLKGNGSTSPSASSAAATREPHASAAVASAAGPAPLTHIRVHPAITRRVGGIDRIPNIFGATVNGSTMGQAPDLIKALNLNSARAYLWPLRWWKKAPKDFVTRPITPGQARQYGKGPASTPDQARAIYNKYYKQDFKSLMTQWMRDHAKSQSTQLYQARLFEDWGLTRNLIFHTQVDASGLNHPDGVNRYYDAYLDMLHAYAPKLDLTFVQMTNEPNYSWFRWPFDSQKEAAQAWIKMFNRLDNHLRQTHPKTTLLGPCLASSAFFSWADWKDWTVPVLEGVDHPLKYFNYHCYDVPAYTHLAWVEMLQAQAQKLGKPRPRAVVTEMNDGLRDKTSQGARQRFAWWGEQLFMAMNNPDKFDIFNYFLLGYKNFSPSNLLDKTHGQWTPNATYWLYWTLADLRGRSVYVEPLTQPGLKVIAAAPTPDALVIAAFNDGDQPRRVSLDLGSTLPEIRSIHQRWAYDDPQGQLEHGEKDSPANAHDSALPTITIPARGVYALRVRFNQAVTPDRTLDQSEFYSKTVAQSFDDDLPCEIDVSRLPGEDESVFLRLGVYSDDLLAARGLDVVFNGRTTPIYWNQAPAQVQRDSQRTVWWLELPIKRPQVKKVNKLVLAHPDAAYRLMFASLVYRQSPSAADAKALSAQARQQQGRRVQAAVNALGGLMSGDRQAVSVAVTNPGQAARDYHVSVALPASLKWVESPKSWQVHVPAGGQALVEGVVQANTTQPRDASTLKVRVASPGLADRVIEEAAIVYARRVIASMATPPHIDGDLTDWKHVKPMTDFHHSALTVRTWMGWDAKYLYLAADVEGAFKPQGPPSVSHFWGKDGIEMFLDLGDQKHRSYDEDDQQLFFCPVGVDNGPALGGRVVRQRRGDNMATVDIVADPLMLTAAQINDHGYRLEAAIPLALLNHGNFHPQPGMRIGLNLAVDHPKTSNTPAFMNSIMGLKTKANARPDQWPSVVFE